MTGANVLFVDDERAILGALQRVVRGEGYGVLVAESPECALDLLGHNNVAVVVSDQRMPGMGGVEFLKRVKEAAPDAVRMMLTGHAGTDEMAAAINQGEVYRFIAKPWDDAELRSTVRAAVERHSLTLENRRLHEKIERQNVELLDAARTLEKKVEDRTRRLREGFFAFVGLCADIVELHDPHSGGHCKRVALLASGFGQRLGLKGAELEALWAAALLHEIGLIGVPREVLDKPEGELDDGERALIRGNPVLSQEILSGIGVLRQSGLVVRSYMENFDGCGYPDGLKGNEINVGSRILAVCDDYDRLRHLRRPMTKTDALAAIEKGIGKRFDPEIAGAFLSFASKTKDEAIAAGHSGARAHVVEKIGVHEITAGMVLASPLVTGKGRMLVARGVVMTEPLIEKVLNFHRIDPITEMVQVLAHA